MGLKEYKITSEGSIIINDKAEVAKDRLREFEPPEGYALAFSGGKDSIVIYDLAVKSGVKFKAHYNVTTLDPPELISFIRSNYKDLKFNMPEMSMWSLILKKGFPPTRVVRYCCEVLKEGGGKGFYTITGVRWAESAKRSKRRIVEHCTTKNMITINPIIDWSDGEVWDYIKENNIAYCSLYDEGFKRLGCIMCPLAGTSNMLKEAKRWPKYYRAYLRVFDKMIEQGGDTYELWKSGQDVMDWWIYSPPKPDPDQCSLFE